MRLLTAVSGVRVPQQAPEKHLSVRCFFCPVLGHEPRALRAHSAAPKRHCGHRIERDRHAVPRSLFRHFVPCGGSSPSRGPRRKHFRWGLFQAPSSPQGELRNNSPFLGELFACMPAAPLRVAKMQDVRCAPRSCGTIAPLSHFCSAGRLRRGFFFLLIFFLSLEPRALNLRSLGGCVVLKREIGCTSRGECCSPSFPS